MEAAIDRHGESCRTAADLPAPRAPGEVNGLAEGAGFPERVRRLLREPGMEGATAARLAARLALSVRSLHRHLHAEGTALQWLKDAARRELALELLARSTRPVKQIAAAAGFRSDKSFARAFRQWTGCTPSDFRVRVVRNTAIGPAAQSPPAPARVARHSDG